MDLKTFLENFDTIAEAPGGIPKLRSLILDLAVRGKLVPQNPEDEPAQELVIRNKKLIVEATNGKKREVPTLQETETALPDGWFRCQLADIALVGMGNSPPGDTYNEDGEGVPLINGPVEFSSGSFGLTVKTKYTTAPSRMCQKGDLLVCVRGATTGRTNIAAFDACIGRGVALIRGWETQSYLNYLLWHLGQQLLQQGKGTTFPSISYSDLAGLEVLLPPLAEQKRIVEKVDELMALCDRFSSTKQTRDNLRQKLRESAIASLMSAETDEELDAAWAFVRDNWCHISQHSEDIDSLRKSVLELAIRGKLAPQNSEDEPASIILEKIQFEKEQLRRNKQTKLDKALPKIERDTLLFEAPFGWEWCYITNISQKVTDGEHITPQRSSSGYYLLSARNVRDEGIVLDDVDYVAEDEFLRIRKRCDPDKGDILISCSGSVGRVTVVDKDRAYVMVRSVALIKPFQSYLFSKYLAYALRAASVQSQITEKSRASAQANLFLGKIKEIKIPLPPLAEQKRIVAKVDELMQLCDQLEASLRQSQKRAESLAASAISHLTI
jgi:type I restriction enzyme, S subunit